MDINIIGPVSGATQAYKPPIPTTVTKDPAPNTTTQTTQTQSVPQTAQSNNIDAAAAAAQANAQAQYEQSIRQAALSFKNFYAISDTEFAIFKDASGQLITRYVSLRDGSVTYVPAPVFVRNIQSVISPEINSRVAIDV